MPGKPLELIPTRYRIEATPAQVLALETTSGFDANPGCFDKYLCDLNQLLHGTWKSPSPNPRKGSTTCAERSR